MNKRVVVEPKPAGLEGVLSVMEEGLVFERRGKRVALGKALSEPGRLGLVPGDRLLGLLQCYRCWTAQPEELVERWLEKVAKGEAGGADVRPVFRAMDFESLGEVSGMDRTLRERKAVLERILEDREELLKNPYLMLDEAQAERFVNSQPKGMQWTIRKEDEGVARSRLEGVACGVWAGSTPKGLDLLAAGGWLDLAEVEARIAGLERRNEEGRRDLEAARMEMEQLRQARQGESRLREAGAKYLDLLKAKGERCLRAIHAGEDSLEPVEAFHRLFESPEIDLAKLENRVDRLRNELEQLYPVYPVARSSSLEKGVSKNRIQWEDHRVTV
jgi:hypothetical protein